MFKRKQPNKAVKIDTLIAVDTKINGDVEFAGGLHLDGYINGNVRAVAEEGSLLSVSESGCVDGSVAAASVVLNGVIKGDIESAERVELGAKARVLGNVHYTLIETAVGAQINGKLIHQTGPRTAKSSDVAPKDDSSL
jgi:cytoskeletal protein CcmA (bactofilin family)